MSNGVSRNQLVRTASHAGSWYASDAANLRDQLDAWLTRAKSRMGDRHDLISNARAIISPHAGYRYSGSCASFGFNALIGADVDTVFVLGPSHHVRLAGCAVSPCAAYATPMGMLQVARGVNEALLETHMFEVMSEEADEDEHSIEMQMPFVARCIELSGKALSQVRIVPILVGSLSLEKERSYGRIFAPYLLSANAMFVISSDFCHWGQRFRYTHVADPGVALHKAIRQLDERGMRLIESLDHAKFNAYLRETGNTICGRHPIGVLLGAVQHLLGSSAIRQSVRLAFLDYAQSNACKNERDSSVSYASAVLAFD